MVVLLAFCLVVSLLLLNLSVGHLGALIVIFKELLETRVALGGKKYFGVGVGKWGKRC